MSKKQQMTTAQEDLVRLVQEFTEGVTRLRDSLDYPIETQSEFWDLNDKLIELNDLWFIISSNYGFLRPPGVYQRREG